MGYGWLTAAMIALIWGFGVVWAHSGLMAAVDILSWEIGCLVLVPMVICLLASSWARRRYGAWDDDEAED
jgi:hypothetical protein